MLSEKFLATLMRAKTPAYRLAARAGVSPSWFSKALHGAVEVQPGIPACWRSAGSLG
jgi:hypothetical protein